MNAELKQFTSFEEILLFDGIVAEDEDEEDIININFELSNGFDSFYLKKIVEAVGINNIYFKNEDELEIYIDSNNISLKCWLTLFEYNCDCGCELMDSPRRIIHYPEIKEGIFFLEW